MKRRSFLGTLASLFAFGTVGKSSQASDFRTVKTTFIQPETCIAYRRYTIVRNVSGQTIQAGQCVHWNKDVATLVEPNAANHAASTGSPPSSPTPASPELRRPGTSSTPAST